jgi:hypothetical protein
MKKPIKKKKPKNNILAPDNSDPECNDFTMGKGGFSFWITVKNRSIQIMRRTDGVEVAIYQKGKEFDSLIDGCFAPYKIR